jgi:hypothetical protein
LKKKSQTDNYFGLRLKLLIAIVAVCGWNCRLWNVRQIENRKKDGLMAGIAGYWIKVG